MIPKNRSLALASFGLSLGTLLLYWPVFHFGFINLDDTSYVVHNFHINNGFTWQGLAWSFQAGYAGNWHPLTWVSLMLDCQLFGVNPGASHAINVLIHATTSVILFLVLEKLTGAFWRSWIVAALFAWHPLHVESVAWIAERKDVLCALFWMLTLWAYARYVGGVKGRGGKLGLARQEPRPTTFIEGRATLPGSRSWLMYVLAIFFFVLALMSKPMAVTLPFALLLLDWWPLGRFSGGGTRVISLIAEKVPLFILSAGCCILTVIAQRGSAIASLSDVPLKYRLTNIAVGYWHYLEKIFWPVRLSIIYPFTSAWPVGEIALAAVVILGVTALCFYGGLARLRRAVTFSEADKQRSPPFRFTADNRAQSYLLFGWFWFIGTLVPVIGLVQVGVQSMADRYGYIPSIGIFVILCWGTYDVLRGVPFGRTGLMCGAIGILTGCLFLSSRQIQDWRDSGLLFSHAVEVTTDNFVARVNYADYLADSGKISAAEEEAQAAVRIAPQEALTHSALGRVLALEGKSAVAVSELRKALEIQFVPSDAVDLAISLTQEGLIAEAIAEYRMVLNKNPNAADALNNLAWILATSPDPKLRNGSEAVQLAGMACSITHRSQPTMLGTLAAAYAEAGRFDDAISTANQARELAESQGNSAVADRNAELMKIYESHRAYHEGQ